MTVIRAAISVDKDTKEEISKQTIKLFREILKKNPEAKIKAVFASQTSDLTSFNCCTSIREEFKADYALECFQEAKTDNQKERIIRLTVFCENNFKAVFVYSEKASQLRPDLATSSETSN